MVFLNVDRMKIVDMTESFSVVTIVVCVQLFHNNCNICLKVSHQQNN